MLLSKLLMNVSHECIKGSEVCEIEKICYDSREDAHQAVFICIKGAVYDGHEHVENVIKNGALAIVAEHEVEVPEGITLIITPNSRLALACMSGEWFERPQDKLVTIGITGTKGKSTTSYMIKNILERGGRKVGLIGTIEAIIGEKKIPAANTTPESYIVYKYFSEMVESGCDTVVMEVSSQGLMLDRVGGIMFDYGLFTNIEPDHIGKNEHPDFESYLKCKSKLFRQCKTGILNADDKHIEEILQNHTCKIETFGINNKADNMAEAINLLKKDGVIGTEYTVSGTIDLRVRLNIPGKFNVYNSLLAAAVCRHFTTDIKVIEQGLFESRVKGRLEPVNISDKFSLMIDYAHNAMALESLLSTLKEYNPRRLVCLFGCGGNRARDRRFEMGEVSSRLADFTVVTSDNPRDEEPEAIIEDIITGVKKAGGKYISIIDRKEAIRYVINNAQDGDVICLAGKGHEDYQEIKGKKYHMDEREIINDIIKGAN